MTRASLGRAVALLVVTVTPLLGAPVLAEADHSDPERTVRWLAAGDSYSAGFGLDGVNLLSPPCSRSRNAWPWVARKVIDTVPGDRFSHVACSGDKLSGLRNQLVKGKGNRDLITFTIGGNDAGFSEALAMCVVGSVGLDPTRRFSWLHDPVTLCPPDQSVRRRIDRFGRELSDLLEAVADDHVTAGGNVVVVGYPALFETYNRWDLPATLMGLCHGVDRAGVERIRGWAGHLNATIGAAVADVDRQKPNGVSFTFVNVNDGKGNNPGHGDPGTAQRNTNLFEAVGSSERHNLCGRTPWMFGGPISTGLYHPNAHGHAAIGAVVGSVLDNLDWRRLDATTGQELVRHLERAPVPSLCDHPAGVLRDGALPPEALRGGGDENGTSTGGVALSDHVRPVAGDLTGDGIDEAAAVISCSAGGVGWPDTVHIYTAGPKHLAQLDLTEVVDTGWEHRESVQSLDIKKGKLTVEWMVHVPGDAMCCASQTVRGTFSYAPGTLTLDRVDVLQDDRLADGSPPGSYPDLKKCRTGTAPAINQGIEGARTAAMCFYLAVATDDRSMASRYADPAALDPVFTSPPALDSQHWRFTGCDREGDRSSWLGLICTFDRPAERGGSGVHVELGFTAYDDVIAINEVRSTTT